MKSLLYILSFFILLFCPAREKAPARINIAECTAEISHPCDNNLTENQIPNKELLLSSAQIYVTIIEEGSTPNIAGRHHHDWRNHSSKKTPFKFLKNGKIIDSHQISLLMGNIAVNSGIFSQDRYLFVIRKLRI